jgi:hypothetical protein
MSTVEAAKRPDLRFDEVRMPHDGVAGDWALYPGSNVGPIAVAPDGDVIFAAVEDAGTWYVFKSLDGGWTWKNMVNMGSNPEDQIIDIEVSPEYDDDTTVLVATLENVYESLDGGEEFDAVDDTPPWEGTLISDMGVDLDEDGRLAIIVGTYNGSFGSLFYDGNGGGEVYVQNRSTTGSSFDPMYIGDAWDVLAVGFIPGFEADGICAVVTGYNEGTGYDETRVRVALGDTEDPDPAGDDWDDDIGDAIIKDKDAATFNSSWARMDFPDDFEIDTDSGVVFVGLYALTDGLDETEIEDFKGDCFKVEFASGSSPSEDLNVRGLVSAFTPTDTNIISVDVMGDAEDAMIIVGTDFWDTSASPRYYTAYVSSDGGEDWDTPGKKQPTGASDGDDTSPNAGAMCFVAWSPTDADVAYAGTSGSNTSAFQMSSNTGESFDQMALIDYGAYKVEHAAASSTYNEDGTFYLVTSVGGVDGACWKTENDGSTYRRIWSYANPDVSNDISKIRKVKTGFFLVDRGAGKLYRTTDWGVTFPKTISAKDTGIATERCVSETTIMLGYDDTHDQNFYWTENAGRKWIKPEDSEIEGTPIQISGKSDSTTVSTREGKLFISFDENETFEQVGDQVSDDGWLMHGGSRNWDTDRMMYGAVYATDGGIYRAEIDPDDPAGADWERIDDESVGAATVKPWLAMQFPGNIMYSIDATEVVLSDDPATRRGGIWRSVNYWEDDEEEIRYELVNRGLPEGVKLFSGTAATKPNTFIVKDTMYTNYWEQLYIFRDTMSAPVTLVSPADGASGAGVILSEFGSNPELDIIWKPIKGATMYEWEVAFDEEMESVAQSGFTEGQTKKLRNLTPGKTYYWRVRVADEDDTGAPLMSPWSATWTFSTALGAGPARPRMVSPYGGPATGGVDAPLQPAMQWTQVFGATGYQLQISKDCSFAKVDIDKKLGLETTMVVEAPLEYSTTYCWRVKAIGPNDSPWSDVGSFTTLA